MGEAPVPPWRLLSPTCVVYTVRDQPALVALAGDAGVKPSNFKQLVGLQANSSVGLPQHKAGWQLLERVWWIARSSWCGLPPVAPLPLASADGRKWVELFYDIHGDAHLDGARLRTLAHKGTHSQRMFVHDGAHTIQSEPSIAAGDHRSDARDVRLACAAWWPLRRRLRRAVSISCHTVRERALPPPSESLIQSPSTATHWRARLTPLTQH